MCHEFKTSSRPTRVRNPTLDVSRFLFVVFIKRTTLKMLSHTVDARVINAGPSSSSSSSAPRCRALLVGVVKEVFVVERGSGVKRLRRSPTPQMISRLGRAACRMSPLNHHLSNAQGSAKMQRTTPGHAHPLTTHTTEDESPKGPQHAQSQRSREGGWGELDLCGLN